MARLLLAALVATWLLIVAAGSTQASAVASAVLVKDIAPGAGSSYPSQPIDLDGTLFFRAYDGMHGNELWKSDGTAAGTVLVRDINPGPASSRPEQPIELDGTVFFNADDGVHGEELWKSDGTSAGTSLVADINPGPASSNPLNLISFDGKVFFSANDGVHGYEPWMSDGTATGTSLFVDVVPVTSGNGFEEAMSVGDTLFLTAADPDNGGYQGTFGEQLWKTDGTAAGTTSVATIGSACCDRDMTFLTDFNGLAVFRKRGGCCGAAVFWRSDGSREGTFEFDSDQLYGSVQVLKGALYYFHRPFEADGGPEETAELWRSDATAEGTRFVAEITPGIPSDVSGASTLGGKLLFFRYTVWPHPGVLSLWESDGTADGTRSVTDIGAFGAPSGTRAAPGQTHRVGNVLFFGAGVAGTGHELWMTDGTAAGTHLVRDINLGEGSSFPEPFSAVDGTLFFSADDGVHGRELWKTTPPLPIEPQRSDYKNASQYCKALREYLGDARFSQRYRNHGECVRASH